MAADPRCIHADAIKKGAIPTPQSIQFFNALITLYSNFNHPSSALSLFRSIPCPNVVTWTATISAFANSPFALHLFLSMLRSALPTPRTFSTVLKTCASIPGTRLGPQLQTLSFKLSAYGNPFVASAFVSLYCKTGDLVSARKVFDEMPERDEVCFAAMVNGLAQNRRPVDALQCFVEMRRQGVLSSSQSLSGVLCAASGLAMLEQCSFIHGHGVVTGLDSDVYVGTALIDAYGKCGMVQEAGRVFEQLEMTVLGLPGWNAMMAAYGQQGSGLDVVNLFSLMENRGIVPDEHSFLAILTAFYNAGNAAEAETWLNRMKLKYQLEPGIEHYTCLIGAMGRAGRLEEAEKLALTIPYKPDTAIWRVLLSSCMITKNTDKAKRIAEELLKLNPVDDSAYVILAKVFSIAGKWDEVKNVWKTMKGMGLRKETGKSWIEVQGRVHVFFSADRRHPRKDEIYAKVRELMVDIEKLGYIPDWDTVRHGMDERDIQESLWYHSEKLAVAFGLLSGVTPPGKVLRIVKNLRICTNCHEAFKFISRVVEREIVVRDVHRYHRFLNGVCSCGDSW